MVRLKQDKIVLISGHRQIEITVDALERLLDGTVAALESEIAEPLLQSVAGILAYRADHDHVSLEIDVQVVKIAAAHA